MKKGISDVIPRVFVYIVYIIFVMMVLMILLIPKCSPRNDIQDTITINDEYHLELKARQELTTLLQTPIPNNIIERMQSLEERFLANEFIEISEDLLWNDIDRVDIERAIEFLESHKELYLEKDYSDFIVALETYNREDSQHVFDLVTRVLFNASYDRHYNSIDFGNTFFSPRIYIYYFPYKPNSKNNFGSQKLADLKKKVIKDSGRQEGNLRSLGDSITDEIVLLNPLFDRAAAFSALPLAGNGTAIIRLEAPRVNTELRVPSP